MSIKSSVQVVLMHYVTLYGVAWTTTTSCNTHTHTHELIYQQPVKVRPLLCFCYRFSTQFGGGNQIPNRPPSRWKINVHTMRAAQILFTFAHRGAFQVPPRKTNRAKQNAALKSVLHFNSICKAAAQMCRLPVLSYWLIIPY